MIRVGIVGMGFMGRVHLNSWRQTPAEFVGCYSLLPYEESIPHYDDLDALLSAVDVIDICTPTHTHKELVLKAAAAGVHIICEKPLALSLADGQEMIEACKAAGVKLLVAHVVRFFPQYARAKASVERGEIGQVAVMRLTRASFKPRFAEVGSWFHDSTKSGGMILDLMIHDFDYARWVAGEVEHVFAKNAAGRFPNVDGDYAIAILKHKSGAISNIEGGWVYPNPLFRTALEIAGDQGLIELAHEAAKPIAVYRHQSATTSADIAVPASPLAQDPYTTQIKHFYDVLTADAQPRLTAEDGLAALQIALAAIQSAQTGRRVFIEEVRA